MDAFAEFPTHKVLEACLRFTKARDAVVTEKIEPIIREAMAPRWYRAARSHEQAIAHLESCSNTHPYKRYTRGMWSNHATIVNGVGWLARLADQSGVKTVQLSNAAAVALAPYLKAEREQP